MIHVKLVEGRNPRIYNTEITEDLTGRVQYVKIMPHRKAIVVLLRKDEKGKYPFVEPGKDYVATEQMQVNRIEGTWTSQGDVTDE